MRCNSFGGFPGTAAVKNLPANAGEARDAGLVSGLGRRYLGVENGNPLQCSCLKNPMDRGDWWGTVHDIAKNQAGQRTHMHKHAHTC